LAYQQNIIAVIVDCDDTLGDDTTNFLLKSLEISPDEEFWPKVTPKIERGWDPPLAYMDELIKMIKERKLKVTRKTLEDIGKRIQFYQGIPRCFEELQNFVGELSHELDLQIEIEFYVISSGFEEVIKASAIGGKVNEIFACTFEYDRKGNIASPKSIVTFTEKTKFVFAINKGISGRILRRNPGRVNDVIPEDRRRIPLRNMIYLGDGPTDIPCFSVIVKGGGKGIGIIKKERPERGVPLWKGRRLTVGPYMPIYTQGSDLRIMLEQLIKDIAIEIFHRSKASLVP